MKKLYSIYLVLMLFGPPVLLHAGSHSTATLPKLTSSFFVDGDEIEGFKMFPNPVTNGQVTIITRRNLTKDIIIFDVLGKEVLKTSINNNTLSVSSLNTGVYILKVTEDGKTSTRKLVIR